MLRGQAGDHTKASSLRESAGLHSVDLGSGPWNTAPLLRQAKEPSQDQGATGPKAVCIQGQSLRLPPRPEQDPLAHPESPGWGQCSCGPLAVAGSGAVSEPAQSAQHSSCSRQMPVRVAAASGPGGGRRGLAKPWGTKTFFPDFFSLSGPASRKNKSGTERRWLHQGASTDQRWGMEKGVGHCWPCHSTGSARDDCCPVEVAAAAAWLFASIAHSAAKGGLACQAPWPAPGVSPSLSQSSSLGGPGNVAGGLGQSPAPEVKGRGAEDASSHMARGPGQGQAWQRLARGVGEGEASFLGGRGALRAPGAALSWASWRTGSFSGGRLPWAFLSLGAAQRFAIVERPEQRCSPFISQSRL